MKYSFVLFGCSVALVAFVQPVSAKSAIEIEAIARSVSVEMISGEGSGVMIHRQGSLYTVITNRHVVCEGKGLCDESDLSSSLQLKTADDRVYKVGKSAIKLLKNDQGEKLDLAIVQFSSNRNYMVAQVAELGSLKVEDKVYTAGFPLGRGWLFGQGEAKAVVNKWLEGSNGGYTVVYDAETLPGMSGGGAFNSAGHLVAIHGYGDRYTANTEAGSSAAKSEVASKIGFNRGISIRWVVQGLGERGIIVGSRRLPRALPVGTAGVVTADEFFIAGFNKWVEPGDDVQAGRQEAVEKLSRAIALNAKYTTAYFMRAYVYNLLGNFSLSLADYNKAIELNPKNATAYNNRGTLKYELKDIQGALADYNQAIELNPKYATAYTNRGVLKVDKLNDPQGALADYNQAIALNPKYADAYNNRGVLKVDKLNDPQGALADYNQAIALNPKYADAYNNRGVLKVDKLNDPQGALADYNQAIELNPKYANAYNNRGNLKDDLNDPQGALADYNQAIELNPKYATAYTNRGVLKVDKLNDPQGALADYNQVIELNPKFAEAYNNRGVLKYELKDIQGALADYNQAIKLNPKYADAYYNRGNLKYELKDIQGALADYNQAIKLNPKYADAYYNRGNLKYELKDIQGALADYNQSIELNPKFAEAYNNRGVLKYGKLKDRPGAIQDLQIAAQLYRSQGNTTKAQQILDFLRQIGISE